MLLRKIEAAKKLGCSPANVTKLTKSGKLDVVGGRVTVESVERYLENRDPARAELGRVMKPNAPLVQPSGAPRSPAAPIATVKRTAGAQMTPEGHIMLQAAAVKAAADAKIAEIAAAELDKNTVSADEAEEVAALMARVLRLAAAVAVARLEGAMPAPLNARQRETIDHFARSAIDAVVTAVSDAEGAPRVVARFKEIATA